MDMAKQVYCSNCGNVGKPQVAGSFLITLILLIIGIIPGIIYEIWRMSNKRCKVCNSSAVMPLSSPIAQQKIAQTQQQSVPQPIIQQQPLPQAQMVKQPVAEPQPIEVKEHYAIDRDINGGLVEYFGLQTWYETSFSAEQQHRLETDYTEWEGNKLATGGVRFKFPNIDVLQFFHFWLEQLKAKRYDDVRPIIDDEFKDEAGRICKIDDDRWANEKYYKSWFGLMAYRLERLDKLKNHREVIKARFDPVKDDCTTEPCLTIASQEFDVRNGELDRAFDTHFAEPIRGCRCGLRMVKSN